MYPAHHPPHPSHHTSPRHHDSESEYLIAKNVTWNTVTCLGRLYFLELLLALPPSGWTWETRLPHSGPNEGDRCFRDEGEGAGR